MLQKKLVSYHLDKSMIEARYAKDFKTTDFDELSELGEYVLRYVWSPCTWWFGTRQKKKFKSTHLCALDFDKGKLTLEGAVKWCNDLGFAYLLGTTKSHQKEKVSKSGKVDPPCDRFRLIIPYQEPIVSLTQYEYNMKQMMQLLPADSACVDGARFFYPCTDVVACRDKGKALAPIPAPVAQEKTEESIKKFNDRTKESARLGRLPNWILRATKDGTGIGGRHKMCFRIAATLYSFGWSEERIVALIAQGPLLDIGLYDVKRQVQYGWAKGRADHLHQTAQEKPRPT